MLAQKRATRSRPSYSKGIGGIEMKTSSVRRATNASRSADSHALTNLATIASSEGASEAGGGSRSAFGALRRCKLARARIGALAVLLAMLFLPNDEDAPAEARKFDLTGFLLVSPALVLFLYGSDHLHDRFRIWVLLLD